MFCTEFEFEFILPAFAPKFYFFCTGDASSLDDSLTNIQWLCSLDSNPLLDQEEEKTIPSPTETTSMNPYPKPPFSYATLILLAINSTEEKRMTLQDIYKWIEDNFPYYQHCKKAWKVLVHLSILQDKFILESLVVNITCLQISGWSIYIYIYIKFT